MKYYFLKSLNEAISSSECSLKRGDINSALKIIHNFVEDIITNPFFTGHVFASIELDQLCLKIGSQSFEEVKFINSLDYQLSKNTNVVAYVVSRLQKSGGHSRLVIDFIKAQPDRHHLILITGVGGGSDLKYFRKIFSSYDNVEFLFCPFFGYKSRLQWIQRILIKSTPIHVHLLSAHQDSAAVAALVPQLNLNISFYHHGDHHLCLGVFQEHMSHVDLHPTAYYYCRDELGVENSYLPLSFEDKKFILFESSFSTGGHLTTATAARFNKLEVPYCFNYLEVIVHVMKTTGGRHIHIGKLTPWYLMRLHLEMRKCGVPSDRFVYIEWASSVWAVLQEFKVDLYLTSFPHGGGLTLVEVMGAGIPVAIHKHRFSPVISALELAYPGAFAWADPAELYSYIAKLQPQTLKVERKLSRLQYDKFHNPKFLFNYFASLGSSNLLLSPPTLTRDLKSNQREWTIWLNSQSTLFLFANIHIFRFLRKCRSLIFKVKVFFSGWASK